MPPARSWPAWLSRHHPIVVRELANLKHATTPKWPLPPAVTKALMLILQTVGSLILLAVAGGALFMMIVANPSSYMAVAAAFATEMELILAAAMLGQGGQMFARERVQHTWNALRLTTLSDATLVGGKVYALLRFSGAAWLLAVYAPRVVVLGGVIKTLFSPWAVSSWAEGLGWAAGGVVLLGWLTIYPLIGPICAALAGVAAATFGPPKYTQMLTGGVAMVFMLVSLVMHIGVNVALQALLGLKWSPSILRFAAFNEFMLVLGLQWIIVQPMLNILAGGLSWWVVRRRLPYLTE